METLALSNLEHGIVSHLFEKAILPPQAKYRANIGLVGIGFELHFDWNSILENYQIAKESLKQSLPKDRFNLVCSKEPLQTPEDVLGWLEQAKKEGLDGVIIYQGSFMAGELGATVARWLMQNPTPVLSWSHDEATGARLSNNRLCAQNFLLNIFKSSGVKYSWLFESPRSESLAEHMMVFAKAVYAKASINQRTIGMIGGFRVPGFYDCELNEMALLKRFGIKVDRVDFETIWEHGKRFSGALISEIKEELLNHPLCKYNNVAAEQIEKSIRLSLAIVDFSREKNYLGVGLKNWPELFDHYGIAGDGAGALIQDLGIPVADESDMGALITMVLMNQLSLEEAIPTLVDLSLIEENKNRIGFWHCGGAPTKLIDTDSGFEVRNHSILENYDEESSMGMLLEFLQKTGPVTIAKYQYPDAGRVMGWEGEIKPSKMAFRGSYAEVEPKENEAKDILSSVMNNGLDHHWIIGRGHLLQEIQELNHWLEIQTIDIEKSNSYLYGHSNR
ncbi:hypothetical protein R9C00_08590 [Flammeovirgaceae bacterium SG7u.111]|nr:hypothetical protein [Flammeovirgaceae bacterium SG7u.132]WPO37504.1 hypothetical protein R9C00_08590 [Flammeovirgaceae bacterium SG7u.111]